MKKYIKWFSIVLCLVMVICFSACGSTELVGIKIETTPSKTTFIIGDEFTFEGGKIVAEYSDETTKTLDFTAEGVTVTSPDMMTVGEKDVTVTYGEKSAAYKINVKAATVTVTFVPNFAGAENWTVEVEKGSAVQEPTDVPENGNKVLDGWITEDLVRYDFDTPVTENITLTADWMDAGEVRHNVTLDYNYGGQSSTVRVKDNSRLTSLETPVREGYDFFGWYTDKECSAKFVTSTRITADTTLYAGWGKIGKFEAEDVDFSEFIGSGYSNGVSGTGAISKSGAMYLGAENGRFVTGLYHKTDNNYNTDLVFEINCSAEVTANLYLRLSAEFVDIVLDGNNYQVVCNEEVVAFDDSITLNGSINSDMGGPTSYDCLQFKDYKITSNLHLKSGKNTIVLRVNNSDKGVGGTMYSSAPMVDNIKISALNTEISWAAGYPVEGNYTA